MGQTGGKVWIYYKKITQTSALSVMSKSNRTYNNYTVGENIPALVPATIR